MKIQGKTVLITGACSGIGKIMARRCLEKGAAQVIIWDICGLYTVMDHFTGRKK